MRIMTWIAFDIDGTIYDCGEIVVDAFQEGAERYTSAYGISLQTPSREDILSVVGLPTDDIFLHLYPGLPGDTHKVLNTLSMECLTRKVRDKGGIVFPGVIDTIRSLHRMGKKLLVASNGKKDYINAILETYGISNCFSHPLFVINGEIKNKTDIVRRYKSCLSRNDLLIMIGDRTSDLDAARSNGIPFIGCAFGHAGIREIQGERWIARSFTHITNLVGVIEKEFSGSDY